MRFLAAFLAFFCLATPVLAAPKFPALTGRVVDDANILSADTKSDLDGKLAALEAKTSRQLVVVTIPSLQGYEISDFGYQLGRAWGIGQSKLNNGALLIIAPTEHKVRIEVGYGLEPILTDALSEVIIQTQILPAFRKNDFNGGTQAGADAIIAQLSLDPSAAEAKVASAEAQVQHGGGSGAGIVPFIFGLIVFFFIFGRLFGGRFSGGIWPALFLASSLSNRRDGGGWGGGFGGGFGGGGFSGGGGSFGGGGASGGW